MRHTLTPLHLPLISKKGDLWIPVHALRAAQNQYFLNPDDQLYERRGLLNYKPVSLADRQRLEPYIQEQHFENSANCSPTYIWRLSWHVEWAIYGGALYFRMRMPGKCQLYPVMPLDGNLTRDMIDVAIADMRKSGLKPIMGSVSEEYLTRLKAVMPEGVSAEENIDFEDYVYRAEDLRELAGRRYHGKRNHVARFMRDYAGRFTYRPLRACDREACLALWDKWYAERVGIMDNAQLLDAAQRDDRGRVRLDEPAQHARRRGRDGRRNGGVHAV